MKPILFNTEMVRAILDGRKTQTRRLVHSAHIAALQYPARLSHPEMTDQEYLNRYTSPKYYVGDILYVRETWGTWSPTLGTMPRIYYRADYDAPDSIEWKPSIHMPKDAARIFLRVTDVGVERLQDIRDIDIYWEGVRMTDPGIIPDSAEMREGFSKLWDSTVKKSDRDRYGWDANPWVWVIKFERISKKGNKGMSKCNHKNCPMQVGSVPDDCNIKECPYRTKEIKKEVEKSLERENVTGQIVHIFYDEEGKKKER